MRIADSMDAGVKGRIQAVDLPIACRNFSNRYSPRMKSRLWNLILVLTLMVPTAFSQNADFKRTLDIIYGRKFGTALPLDVIQPAKPNGVGIIFVVSGGWFSSHDSINPRGVTPFLDRGYTIFAVVHG